MLKILSHGILKLPNLDILLAPEYQKYQHPQQIEAVIGWGYKATAVKARALAQQLAVPYIGLEDGFLRSVELGVTGARPLSICVDPIGCYYDASKSSFIEQQLADRTHFTTAMQQRAQKLITLITTNDLSKYNHAPAFTQEIFTQLGITKDQKVLLLVDQCAGDSSLIYGEVPDNVGAIMLQRATELYPQHTIVIKVHPDVLAGKRKGLFNIQQLPPNIKLLATNVSPISLLQQVDVVFVATSQMGFEALLLNKTVHCFGKGFYAGYGLTHDEYPILRRQQIKGVTIAELFYIAYVELCRYLNPITEQLTEIEDIISLLVVQRHQYRQHNQNYVVFNTSLRKFTILRNYLQTSSNHIFATDNPKKALQICAQQHATLVLWASAKNDYMRTIAKEQGITTVNVEDGFLRSNGLGCLFALPYSLVFDHGGIYYNPQSQSDLITLLNTLPQRANYQELVQRGRELRQAIVANKLTKYNVGEQAKQKLSLLQAKFPQDQEIILVPGQVETDASVRTAGHGITSNQELLRIVRAQNPHAYIIYKPHPDVLAQIRIGDTPTTAHQYYDAMVTDLSIEMLYEIVDSIHTLCSLSGFEALLRGKKVVTYGKPFYAGWGITTDLVSSPERTAKLSVDALVAGVLILYACYYDWYSKMLCRPEDIIYRLLHPKVIKLPWSVRFISNLYTVKNFFIKPKKY